MARPWKAWETPQAFAAALPTASAEQLHAMQAWAADRERDADNPGMRRNPKVRRMYRRMRERADAELVSREADQHADSN